MSKLKQWAVATAERAVKTAAQTAIASISTTAALDEIDWAVVGSVTGLATLLSVLTSVASISFTDNDSPAAFGPEQIKP